MENWKDELETALIYVAGLNIQRKILEAQMDKNAQDLKDWNTIVFKLRVNTGEYKAMLNGEPHTFTYDQVYNKDFADEEE